MRRRTSGIQRIGEGRYRIRVDVLDPKTGRRVDVKRIVKAASTTDAARLRETLRAEIASGASARHRERPRLGDAVVSWLRSIAPALKRSTADLYACVFDVHVIPKLGDHFVDAITKDDLVALRDAWAKTASPVTVNGRLRILRQCLASICDELRIADPSRFVASLRTTKRAVPKGLEPDEAGRVLRELERMSDDDALANYALALVLVTTGLRWGEATALVWSDVDFEHGEVRVERAHVRGHVDTAKTEIVKVVPLVPEVADVLRRHRAEQIRQQAAGLEAGLVFPSSTGTHRQPSSIRKRLAKACTAANVRAITPHGFRHTMNHAARKVATDETVRAITGHVTAEMTSHYDWVNAQEKREAVGGVVRLLGLGSKSTPPGNDSGSGTSSGTSEARKTAAG
jgi:integrase